MFSFIQLYLLNVHFPCKIWNNFFGTLFFGLLYWVNSNPKKLKNPFVKFIEDISHLEKFKYVFIAHFLFWNCLKFEFLTSRHFYRWFHTKTLKRSTVDQICVCSSAILNLLHKLSYFTAAGEGSREWYCWYNQIEEDVIFSKWHFSLLRLIYRVRQ